MMRNMISFEDYINEDYVHPIQGYKPLQDRNLFNRKVFPILRNSLKRIFSETEFHIAPRNVGTDIESLVIYHKSPVPKGEEDVVVKVNVYICKTDENLFAVYPTTLKGSQESRQSVIYLDIRKGLSSNDTKILGSQIKSIYNRLKHS